LPTQPGVKTQCETNGLNVIMQKHTHVDYTLYKLTLFCILSLSLFFIIILLELGCGLVWVIIGEKLNVGIDNKVKFWKGWRNSKQVRKHNPHTGTTKIFKWCHRKEIAQRRIKSQIRMQLLRAHVESASPSSPQNFLYINQAWLLV